MAYSELRQASPEELKHSQEESPEGEDRSWTQTTRPRWLSWTLGLALGAAIFVSSTLLGISLARHRDSWQCLTAPRPTTPTTIHPSFTKLGDCGQDIATAKQNGCVFDLIMGQWVPSPCFDQVLHDRYLQDYGWPLGYFWDISLTTPAPQEIVRGGNYNGTFLPLEFHFHHCAYVLQHLMKGYTSGAPVLEGLWSYHHAEHCTQLLESWEFPGKNTTFLRMGFATCIQPRLE